SSKSSLSDIALTRIFACLQSIQLNVHWSITKGCPPQAGPSPSYHPSHFDDTGTSAALAFVAQPGRLTVRVSAANNKCQLYVWTAFTRPVHRSHGQISGGQRLLQNQRVKRSCLAPRPERQLGSYCPQWMTTFSFGYSGALPSRSTTRSDLSGASSSRLLLP